MPGNSPANLQAKPGLELAAGNPACLVLCTGLFAFFPAYALR